jgi:EpsI family protein
MVACVFVPIIGNGFRALGIVLLAHFSDNRIAVGADHLVYGWGFSVAILALLMFVGSKFADDPAPDEYTARPETGQPAPAILFPVTILVAFLAISAVPGYAAWRSSSAVSVDRMAFAAPPAIAGWRVDPVSRDWAPLYGEPDAKLAFALSDPSSPAPPVDVFVNYYESETEGRNLISSQNKMWDEERWHPVLQDGANAHLGGDPVRFRELQIGSGGTSRLVWWTYVSSARFTTSAMDVKLDRVRSALAGGRGAAVIAISTIVDSDLDAARSRLRRAGAALAPLKARIDGSNSMQP